MQKGFSVLGCFFSIWATCLNLSAPSCTACTVMPVDNAVYSQCVWLCCMLAFSGIKRLLLLAWVLMPQSWLWK